MVDLGGSVAKLESMIQSVVGGFDTFWIFIIGSSILMIGALFVAIVQWLEVCKHGNSK